MSDSEAIELNADQLKELMEEGGINKGFVGLAHALTGMTGADALLLVIDRDDDPIQIGAIIRPGFDRFPMLIEALEKVTHELKENQTRFEASAASLKAKTATKH